MAFEEDGVDLNTLDACDLLGPGVALDEEDADGVNPERLGLLGLLLLDERGFLSGNSDSSELSPVRSKKIGSLGLFSGSGEVKSMGTISFGGAMAPMVELRVTSREGGWF